MAYFPNGCAGEILDNQCADCPLGDGPCPVALVQMKATGVTECLGYQCRLRSIERVLRLVHLGPGSTAAASKVRLTKRFTSHAFRHTFATYMLANGTDIMTLASMLGHNDIRTTQLYLHCNLNSGEMQRTPFGNLLAGVCDVKQHSPMEEMLRNPQAFKPRLYREAE